MMRSALPILAIGVLLGPSVALADNPNAPAPASAAPAPPTEIAPVAPSGQWVYASQYGWVWMPYDQRYTYVSPDADAYMFVYYPTFGWCWVGAPWILGVGPAPYWGRLGVAHFAWYARPWFRVSAPHRGGGGAFGHGAMGHGFHGGGGGGHAHR